MRPRVYVETSVLSYLTALPTRDLVLAAHQQITSEWWTAREAVCRLSGFEPPTICTPEELRMKEDG